MKMKKCYVTIVMFFLIFITAINCYGKGSVGSVAIRYVGESPMGYYEVTMDYNNYTDYQMGQLYGKILFSQYPGMETGFANYLNGLEDYDLMMERVQQLKPQIPQEYRDFLDGLASQLNGGNDNVKNDGKLSVDEVFFFSLVSEIHRTTQCSVVAVYDSASDTKRPIIGRLVDWSSLPHGVIYFIKKGNKKIINIGTSLLSQGVSTGLNHHGIFVATLDAPTGKLFPSSLDTYYSYHFDLRYALENYKTIDDIANYLSQNKYTFNHLIVLGDSKTVKVLENDLDGNRALRDANSELNQDITWGFSDAIAAVNAFLLKGNYDNFTGNPNNENRWQSIIGQLNLYLSNGSKITVDDMKEITTYYGTNINTLTDGGIMTNLTQQIIIYDSRHHELHVFFRNNRIPGDVNNETTFDVNNPEFFLIPAKNLSKSNKD